MRAETLGWKDGRGRQLLLLSVNGPSALHEFEAPAPFVSLIAWDSRDADDGEIAAVVETILSAGAAYICVWGNDCERLHDFFDESICDPHVSSGEALEIVTTWHARESIEDALWFAMFCAQPADVVREQCTACVLVVVGSPGYEAALREALVHARAKGEIGE